MQKERKHMSHGQTPSLTDPLLLLNGLRRSCGLSIMGFIPNTQTCLTPS